MQLYQHKPSFLIVVALLQQSPYMWLIPLLKEILFLLYWSLPLYPDFKIQQHWSETGIRGEGGFFFFISTIYLPWFKEPYCLLTYQNRHKWNFNPQSKNCSCNYIFCCKSTLSSTFCKGTKKIAYNPLHTKLPVSYKHHGNTQTTNMDPFSLKPLRISDTVMAANGQEVFKGKQLNRLQKDYETIAFLFAFFYCR